MKIMGRKCFAGIVLAGIIFGLAATVHSTQARGFLQTVPTRGPSPTATVPTRAAGPTSAPLAATETAVKPIASQESPIPSITSTEGSASITPLPIFTATPDTGTSASATPSGQVSSSPEVTATRGAILTRPTDTPPPPSSISASTLSAAGTEPAGSGGGLPGPLLVAGPLALIVLIGLFFGLRRRGKSAR